MTTRRALLGVAGAALLAGCTASTKRPEKRTHLIFVTTKDGVSVLDQVGRVVTPPTAVAAVTRSWGRVVTAQPDGANTRVLIQDLATGQVSSAHTLRDRFEPRIVTPDGELIASVPPGGAGSYGLHKPGGRERTTLVVSGPAGERSRLDLPGNIEPEVFSAGGDRLFVLDYLPAGKPDRFRMRTVDLATGRLAPLLTRAGRPVPAEEEMRAHRIETVHDERRGMFYTLYSYEPAAVAFVHCVHLGQGWARRVDLPAPFGRERPGVHAIALSPSGERLIVVHAPSASVADIDPDRLVVARVGRFAETGQQGKPNVRITPSGRLVVNVDRKVVASDPRREIATPGQARGLVLGAGDEIWVGHPDGLARYDLGTGAELGRIAVRELFTVKHVRALA